MGSQELQRWEPSDGVALGGLEDDSTLMHNEPFDQFAYVKRRFCLNSHRFGGCLAVGVPRFVVVVAAAVAGFTIAALFFPCVNTL
jgi:hypothetical protein